MKQVIQIRMLFLRQGHNIPKGIFLMAQQIKPLVVQVLGEFLQAPILVQVV